MNDMTVLETYGRVTALLEITIQRKLPGPIERIWDYLTDSELRSQWLASGIMPADPGSVFELVWRNDELTEDAEARPEGFPEEQRMTSEIVAFEAPHRLAFTWPPRGEVSIELKTIGSDVLLTLVHKRISDRKNMTMVGAGWHMHLDILAAKASGQKPGAFWQGWLRLRDEYDRLIPE
ncbi:ATPase [Rhizobiales bacterium RZME27]|uniref:ATPase n=1 Tax=Endobacterium cereale TaxID=2663029 RepID=A0A6A8AF71_9HYPH|nr:SRPBCC family protein [Endobacterium cereale]MEB2842993.1 SRPBCC family protein [Endobacterium cereale]MQY49752.1 ATPase [Endobacterium cereale]